jgi:hypothetical protein
MRYLRISVVLTVAGLLLTAFPGNASGSNIEPGTLLIYYSYPSSINGTFNVLLAADELGQYDYVVLGAGLEKTTHPDHGNTVSILADASMGSTVVFGYIDLGVSTNNFTQSEIETRIDEWQLTGADGIFFDDYGYDFGTGRSRQNDAVNYAHGKSMPVVANAFSVADAFSDDVDATYNPAGTSTSLGATDFYLFESHQVRIGVYESESTWQTKANQLDGFQQALGFRIFSVTTNDAANIYDQGKFFYSWHSALLYGHDATDWGEYNFASITAQAPFRTRPATDCGSLFAAGILNASPLFTRTTDIRNNVINTASHVYGCAVGSAVPDAVDLDDDDDGMTDTFESANGLDPLDAGDASGDPDNDGLNNVGEFNAGSNPNNPDSDSDGIIDGLDRDPDLASNECSGENASLQNLIVDTAMTCAVSHSILVQSTVQIQSPGQLELISPRVTINPEVSVGDGGRMTILSVNPGVVIP